MPKIPLILIKLGGSVVTEKSLIEKPRLKIIAKLAKVIAKAQKKSKARFIIGHGQGSFGHVPAKKYGLFASKQTSETIRTIDLEKIKKGAKETKKAALKLHQIILDQLLLSGVPATSFLISKHVTTHNYLAQTSDLRPLTQILDQKRIPLTGGDIMPDQATHAMIWSTEQVFAHLTDFLVENKDYQVIRQIMVTDVDGVLDENGDLIAKITPQSFAKIEKSSPIDTQQQVAQHIGSSKNVDVTGGMQHKIESALKLAKKTGIETHILSGLEPEQLELNLAGHPWKGTIITR